jgi:flagellar basal body rod protein FlgG
MNVGLYSGAAGMRVGQDYQSLITENLAMQSVPGFKQSLPVFTTDMTLSSSGSLTPSGNPAAIHMSPVTDFSQGPIEPSTSPYHLAVEGKSFFEVKEADGTTTYTRNGAFTVSPTGQVLTSDGAAVCGSGGTPLTVDPTKASQATIGSDGTISIDGTSSGKFDLAHFGNAAASLTAIAHGRFSAKAGMAQEGPAAGDQILSNSLEGSNSNPIEAMADMIQASRLYEANSKSIAAVDDNTNQLITAMGRAA